MVKLWNTLLKGENFWSRTKPGSQKLTILWMFILENIKITKSTKTQCNSAAPRLRKNYRKRSALQNNIFNISHQLGSFFKFFLYGTLLKLNNALPFLKQKISKLMPISWYQSTNFENVLKFVTYSLSKSNDCTFTAFPWPFLAKPYPCLFILLQCPRLCNK